MTLSPSSGSAADGDITVKITCSANTTYDARSAVVTVRLEDMSESITITQDTGVGLIVSPTTLDLTNAAQDIEIEVQKNVQYSITIDDAGKSWITHTGTKGLSSEKASFSIAANDSYDNREAKITFKQTDGSLSETVVVRQSQTNGLFITTPEYDLSNEAHTISVEIKANVQFEVTSEAEWIKYVETKALTPSSVVLSIEANESYDNRTGAVLVKQTNGDLTGTITINQKQTDYLSVTPTSFYLTNEGQSVTVEIKDNVCYSVIIPDDARSWISVQSNTQTKALTDDKVVLAIAQNSSYDNREASVTIKQTDGPLAETVKITQAQTDGLFITTPEYNLSNESHTLSVEVQANVSFEVTPEAEWIHYVQTKALNSSTITLTIDANETYDSRTGKVSVKQSNGNLTGEITVNQAEKFGLFVSPEEFNLTKDEQTINVEVKYNVEYDVVIPDAAKDWVSIQNTPPTKGLTTETVTFAIAENKSYVSRETAIAFKQKNGDLTGTVKISQDQTDYLSITPQKDSIVYSGGSVNVSVITNVEYELSLDDTYTWVTIGEGENIGTKDGLTTYVYSISAPENEEIVPRYASIQVKSFSGDINTSFVLAQGPQPIIEFKDKTVKKVCVSRFDINQDGEVSLKEAKLITVIPEYFFGDYAPAVQSFDELGLFSSLEKIEGMAFRGCSLLQSVKLPDGITYIGSNAFMYCSELNEIMIPDSMIELDYWALAYSGITKVSLPSSLKAIKGMAFFECTKLESIVIPDSVSEIGNSAFTDCFKLQSVTLPKNLTVINDAAFSDCHSLKQITIPQGVISIGKRAFGANVSLEIVEFNSELVSIGISAFDGCRSLSSISLPNSLLSISDDAFNECVSLAELSLPNNVISLGDRAFKGCSSMMIVSLPKSIKSIGESAFEQCPSLKSITVSANVVPSGSSSMFNATNDCPIFVPWQSLNDYKTAEYWCDYASRIQADPIVDLGLSVKWAAFNLGATTPEGYGEYYAWGDSEPYYAGKPYKWRNAYGLIKYCQSSKYRQWGLNTEPDNKTELDPEDDAAHVNLGGKWRIPKKDEWEELYNQCTWSWTTVNGIAGYLVTSNIEGNGNSIFLPAAGVFTTSVKSPVAIGENGGYHSSTLSGDPSTSSSLYFVYHADAPSYQNHLLPDCGNYPRTYGQTIRAVYE